MYADQLQDIEKIHEAKKKKKINNNNNNSFFFTISASQKIVFNSNRSSHIHP